MEMRKDHKRGGATAIELALVMIPLLMMIFGIFEYGRLGREEDPPF